MHIICKRAVGSNARKSVDSRATNHMKKDGFKIILGVMCRCKNRNTVFSHYHLKKLISSSSALRFKRIATLERVIGDICPARVKGEGVFFCERLTKLLVAVCLVASYSVIEVGNVKGISVFFRILV